MNFKTGRFAGKSTEEVLLKRPDWAQSVISRYPDAGYVREFSRLIKQFDAKRFTARCTGTRCKRRATRASVYWGSPNLMFWCGGCYPGDWPHQKLSMIESFDDALEHIDCSANGNREWKRHIIRALAQGKGLPKKVGKKQAAEFFAEEGGQIMRRTPAGFKFETTRR